MIGLGSGLNGDQQLPRIMKKYIVILMVTLWAYSVSADTRLANVFTDNMVLQRDMKACIWGTAKVADEIIVSFSGQKKKTIANGDGKWKLYLDPMKANSKSQILRAKGSSGDEIIINNILVGDVWLFSGAGYERTMNKLGHDTSKLLPKAKHSYVRVLRSAHYRSLYPVWVVQHG
jgi:sialate O-acetylesterase